MEPRPGSVAERVETAHGNLVGWFQARGVQREEAEHLAQEAWIRLLRAERRGQVITWPFLWSAVAPNLLRDHWRRRAAYGGARGRVVSLEAMRDQFGDRLRLADAA